MFILKNNLKEIMDLISDNNMIMCHGGDGCGKSSLAEELCKGYKESLIINLELSEINYMAVAVALGKPISTPEDNLNYFINFLNNTGKKIIIFNHVLSCSASSFSVLLNLVKSSKYFSSTIVIGFYNDIKLMTHHERDLFEKIFSDFEPFKVSIEKEDFSEICKYLCRKTHKKIDQNILKKFLETAQYNLRSVIQAINLYNPVSSEEIYKDFDTTRIKLLNENIKKRLDVFKEHDKRFIWQTATVGFKFNTEFIKTCFNIVQIDAILLGIMNYDKQLYIKIKNDTFSFFNQETRNCIYSSLTEEQKIDLNNQIAEFCVDQSQIFLSIVEKINYLNLAYTHYKETNKNEKIYSTGCKLLKLYEYIGDSSSIIELCRELSDYGDQDEKYFIKTYFAYALSSYDKYAESNEVIDFIFKCNSSLHRASTYRYLELTYVRNLYLSSSEPEAYNRCLILKSNLCNCNDNVYLTQLFSILTSIYDNRGDYANSIKSEKQAYFYAEKCKDKLYINQLYLKSQINKSSSIASENLKTATKFFTENRNLDLLAQANHNYGTEMIFSNQLDKARIPLSSAFKYYKDKGSVWSVYPLNNLALLDILNHRYNSALKKLSKPFPSGTELFTIITVLCNKLVCYIKRKDITIADKIYGELSQKMVLAKKESGSSYLKIYVKLMEGLICFHKNQTEKAEKILSQIVIPDNFPFIKEFICGFISKIHGKELKYEFPYIELFVKEEIYLCDFLFIE